MELEEERKIYMQTIRFLDASTEDYLYLYDFVNDKLYSTDKICEKYAIASGDQGISLAEWEKIVYSKDRNQLKKNLADIKNGVSERHDLEYRLVDKNENRVWISCCGKVLKDNRGNPMFLMGSISELRMERIVDNLTGLWNFEKFMKDLGKSIREDNGYLMVFDIDNFKNINMKDGRTFGNEFLKIVVSILEENADGFIKLYRLDGDRFAVNFIRKTKVEVTAFYNVLRIQLEKYCTISAGMVNYGPDDKEDSSIIYQYAENALERAKKEGKDRMIFFSFEDYQKALDKIRLQDELNASVKNDCEGFYLCYQPQIDNKNFKLYGAEALLRYESSWRGIVSPVEFIPILEQTGLICQVGEWVLKTALRQCAKWREKLPDFHINVNISYVQLRQEKIVETVLHALHETGLPGSALTLEVTESMQLQDYVYFNKIFYEWKRHGIKIAIDDFGTGYSSLSYLKSIDVDETKIDRCFVSQIQSNAYNYHLLSNMIELAHGAHIQVCCEGVETEEELMALQELNPDVLQGFLFAKPYRKEEFEESYIEKNTEKYKMRLEKEDNFRRMKCIENKHLIEEQRKDEIVNIVEGMEEVVYVSDKDTYELYYMNPAGRELTGIYDYKGCKCYKVLQRRDRPCENCNNKGLRSDGFHMWEVDNDFLDKHFVVKDKLIPWRGKMARLEIAIDVGKKGERDREEKEELYAVTGKQVNTLSRNFNHRLLNQVDLGLWVIRIDEKSGKCEMYTDDVMNRVMGLKEALSPEECYAYWYGRIEENYGAYIDDSVQKIVDSGKVCQMEYVWNHPEEGKVPVRCVGVRVKDRDGKICIEGYHRMISDMQVLQS